MRTYLAKKETIERKWYILDAADKPMGHTAAKAAAILIGKHRTDYTPNVDSGDFVIILNSDKAVLTGKKLEQKVYRTHSGYVGGLKEVKYRLLMQDKSDFAMRIAVKGMMPKNSLGRWALKRLKIYKGGTHENAAQKPELWSEQ